MIRNLKTLGLALMAILALGAVAASTASAQTLGKITSPGNVTLTGEDTGTKANSFTVFGRGVECPGSTYTGHKVLTHAETTAGKTHELLPSGSTEVTVTPHYKQTSGGTANCDIEPGGLSATVTMNGCDYRFYDFTTVVTASHPEHTYGFLTDIVCPTGKDIEVHAYIGHGHAFQACKTTVQPQTGLHGGTATTTTGAADDIDLTGTITGIKATQSGGCGHAETTEGIYHLDVTVKGHNAAKEPVGVTITH